MVLKIDTDKAELLYWAKEPWGEVYTVAANIASKCEGFDEVIVSARISKVAHEAFSGCSTLKRVRFEGPISYIDSEAFADCPLLEEVVLDDDRGAEGMGGGVFRDCKKLKYVSVCPPRIGRQLFKGCHALERMPRWSGTEEFDLPYQAFAESGLSGEIDLSRFRTIGDEAFKGCQQISQCQSFGNISRIGSRAFADCTHLLSFHCNFCHEVGEEAFANNHSLYRAMIPGDYQFVPAGMFRRCFRLRMVTLAKDLKGIGHAAFKWCRSLNDIYEICGSGLEVIESEAFMQCGLSRLDDLPLFRLKRIGDAAFSYNRKLERVLLTESVDQIGSHAFHGCNRLTSMVLMSPRFPSGLVESGFSDRCPVLVETHEDIDEVQHEEDGKRMSKALYSREELDGSWKGGVLFVNRHDEGQYEVVGQRYTPPCLFIPECVSGIGANLFSECLELERVVLPRSIVKLVSNAFPPTTRIVWGDVFDIV